MLRTTATIHKPGTLSPASLETVHQWTKQYSEYAWSKVMINACHVVEIKRDGKPIAFVWMHHQFDRDDLIEAHIVVHPDGRRRWATPHVLDTLFICGMDMNASYVVGQLTSPAITKIWTAIGAEVHDKVAIIKLKE